MSAEDHINPENLDRRHQHPCSRLQNHIVFGLVEPVIVLSLLLLLFAVPAQQNQHGAGGDEEHMGLAQCVEGPVVQDHARNDVHRAGLLQALLDIALRHLVVGRVLRMAEGGQV